MTDSKQLTAQDRAENIAKATYVCDCPAWCEHVKTFEELIANEIKSAESAAREEKYDEGHRHGQEFERSLHPNIGYAFGFRAGVEAAEKALEKHTVFMHDCDEMQAWRKSAGKEAGE